MKKTEADIQRARFAAGLNEWLSDCPIRVIPTGGGDERLTVKVDLDFRDTSRALWALVSTLYPDLRCPHGHCLRVVDGDGGGVLRFCPECFQGIAHG